MRVMVSCRVAMALCKLMVAKNGGDEEVVVEGSVSNGVRDERRMRRDMKIVI